MRWLAFSILAFSSAATVCPTAVGQAVAEYGLGVGRAATTTAPAGKIANGISGVFDSLSKAAGADSGTSAPGSASSTPEARRTAAHKTGRRTQSKPPTLAAKAATPEATPATPPTPQEPAPVYEDPRQIRAGIEYNELLRRFGPPSMSVTTESGISTLWYSSDRGSFQVEVQNGKVIAPRRATSE